MRQRGSVRLSLMLILGCAEPAFAQEPQDAGFWLGPEDAPILVGEIAPSPIFPRTPDLRLGFGSGWYYGPAHGWVQTPSGGEPGTTSMRRPTLDELGIEAASIFDLSMTLAYREHEVILGGQFVRMSGSAELEQTLVSQRNTFPAGDPVHSDLQLDWYRLDYRYRMELFRDPDGEPRLILYPTGGVVLLDFSLVIEDSGLAEVNRSYSKAAPHIGAEAEWRITEDLSLIGAVSASIPLSNMPHIYTAELLARYGFGAGRGMGGAGFIGIAYEGIHYEDNQEVPNDIHVDIGPMLVLGLELRF